MEQGAALEAEAAVTGTEHLGAGEIGGEQVRGELDAVEISFQSLAQAFHRPGLGQPRCPLHQQVPIRQQGDEQALDQRLLAQYALADELAKAVDLLLYGAGRQGTGLFGHGDSWLMVTKDSGKRKVYLPSLPQCTH